jgi:tRNA (guanine-N7-)-methyltransferase
MRMRRKKHGAERIAACSDLLITEYENLKEDPQFSFQKKARLCLEIGCGKGDFACGTAENNPDINLIAMERVADVACLALEKAKSRAESRPDNLRFIIGDAKNIPEWFPEHSIDTIYLNFSDPWPKEGYKKRRLTHRGFLEMYRSALKENGYLRLKTDNKGLFDFSLEEFEACGLIVEWFTYDLHSSEYAEGNVMTEYERNFTSKGVPICSALVKFPVKKEEEKL